MEIIMDFISDFRIIGRQLKAHYWFVALLITITAIIAVPLIYNLFVGGNFSDGNKFGISMMVPMVPLCLSIICGKSLFIKYAVLVHLPVKADNIYKSAFFIFETGIPLFYLCYWLVMILVYGEPAYTILTVIVQTLIALICGWIFVGWGNIFSSMPAAEAVTIKNVVPFFIGLITGCMSAFSQGFILGFADGLVENGESLKPYYVIMSAAIAVLIIICAIMRAVAFSHAREELRAMVKKNKTEKKQA